MEDFDKLKARKDALTKAHDDAIFKAGMQKVVDFIDAQDRPANISAIHVNKVSWGFFLKENGLEAPHA